MPTLLLADDSVTTQRVVALTFADAAFRVVTVSDGQQAIDSMAVVRPDIVLAGTTLPRTNGYELAEYMRGNSALKDVPVLLLSGAFESVDAARLKTSGARGVIEKPLEPTAVISRVRELLGLKDTRPAPPVGRLVTTADTPADRKTSRVPAPPPARGGPVSSWDQLREESGLEPNARSVEGGTAGREDYLDTLDAALDSLDQHLAGRHPEAHSHRNPSPPLGQAAGAADPRSPGRRPSPSGEPPASGSVYEVDNEWFGDDTRESIGEEAHRDAVAGAHEAMPPRAAASSANPIFEIDDEWFAEDEKAREARRNRQRDLAAEMGIHDVELPEAGAVPNAPAPAEGLDFDFGLDDMTSRARQVPVPDSPFAVPPSSAPIATSQAPPPAPQTIAPVASAAPAPAAPAQLAPLPPLTPPAPPSMVASSVADDFAALLAFETGDPLPQSEAPVTAADATPAARVEFTDAMLDLIARRVADRLAAGAFGSDLRDAMTAAVRDTVRAVVSDTSERLVRDEIARVKSRVERDTQ